MTWSYYLKNIGWAIFFLVLVIYDWNKNPENDKMQLLLAVSIPSSLLYPFCKIGVETLALRFTRKEFGTEVCLKILVARVAYMHYIISFALSSPCPLA